MCDNLKRKPLLRDILIPKSSFFILPFLDKIEFCNICIFDIKFVPSMAMNATADSMVLPKVKILHFGYMMKAHIIIHRGEVAFNISRDLSDESGSFLFFSKMLPPPSSL